MKSPVLIGASMAFALLSGCTSVPSGPTVAVMPAPNKPFEVFQYEDILCRNFANREIGGNTAAAQQERQVQNAVVGTAIGAAAGAMIGGGDHDAVGAGAGTGLLVGSAAGMDQTGRSGYELQRRYDVAYMQCMYAKGNQVPGFSLSQAPALPPPPPPPR